MVYERLKVPEYYSGGQSAGIYNVPYVSGPCLVIPLWQWLAKVLRYLRIPVVGMVMLLVLAGVGFSQIINPGGSGGISSITATDGSNTDVASGPFTMSFSGCTVGGTGAAWTITCAGAAANPGGSAHQLQVNVAGTSFGGIANGTAGQVLCSNGATLDPAMCDPVVSGPDAPGAVSTKNPVQIAGNDGTDVRAISTDSSGRLNVDVSGTVPVSGTFWQATQPVSGTFWQTTQPVSIASMPSTPVTGTFWQATQPVSGTFFQAIQPVSATSLPLPTGAATSAKQPALGTAGTASADVITVQGKTGMTPVIIDGSGVTQPVSCSNCTGTVAVSGTVTTTPPSNASTNIAQVSGAATSATNPLFTRETDGTNAVVLDPCRTQANIFKPISQTASAQLVTGTSAKKIYICSINLVTAGANNIAMVEGTGTVCATGTAGMAGGTTAATGWNFAANGGLTQGNGMGSIMAEATNADNLCLLQSAAVQLSGVIGYVVQ